MVNRLTRRGSGNQIRPRTGCVGPGKQVVVVLSGEDVLPRVLNHQPARTLRATWGSTQRKADDSASSSVVKVRPAQNEFRVLRTARSTFPFAKVTKCKGCGGNGQTRRFAITHPPFIHYAPSGTKLVTRRLNWVRIRVFHYDPGQPEPEVPFLTNVNIFDD